MKILTLILVYMLMTLMYDNIDLDLGVYDNNDLNLGLYYNIDLDCIVYINIDLDLGVYNTDLAIVHDWRLYSWEEVRHDTVEER